MSRLLRVELLRLWSRRSVRVLALVAVLVSIGFAVTTGWNTRPLSADERQDARAQARIAAGADDIEVQLDTCEKDPTSYLGRAGDRAGCRAAILPTAADFVDRSPLRLRTVMAHNGLDVALLLVALLVLAGATYAGSDWASGSITNQVLAEPRRGRVFAAKAGALAVAALVVSAAAMAVFWVPLRLLAAQRGLVVTVGADLPWYVARVLVLAVVAAVAAYALTMLLRQTALAVGLVLGVSLAAEVLLGLVPVRGNGWLSPSHNVFAWILGRTSYLDPSVRCAGATCDRIREQTMGPAALLLGGVAVVVVLVSLLAFRRRDLP